MHSTTIRRSAKVSATLSAAALAVAAMAVPTAQAQESATDSVGTVGSISPQSIENVDAASVETSIEFTTWPITDPVGSIQEGWALIDCVVDLPWDDYNCVI